MNRSDLPQMPEMVQLGWETGAIFLNRLEPHIAKHGIVAPDRFTVADISGFFTVHMTGPLGMDLTRWPNAARWFAEISARPPFQLSSDGCGAKLRDQ